MLHILFLIYSFFPVNENSDNFINPYIKINTPLELQDINHIAYKLNFNKNINRNDISIYNTKNNISGSYRYKFILFSFDYKKKYEYFNYKTNDFNLKQNIKKDELFIKSGITKYGFSFLGILDFNFHSEEQIKYGVYLDYDFNVKNIKYKIYLSEYQKQESFKSYLVTQNENFIFPYNYNKKFQILGFNLYLYNKLKFNFKYTVTDIKTLDLPKKDFTIEETSKINELFLKTKMDFPDYYIYFNYIEKFITANLKNELDDVKYAKFIVKDYSDYSYNIGFVLKNLTELSIDIFYQKINSYFYGNIESWPFNDDNSSWVGGRLNFSSKPKYRRYMLRIKNKLNFFNKKFSFSPEIFYDLIKAEPNSKTYEAGFFGMGKQNQVLYTDNITAHLIHLCGNMSFKINHLKFNLYVSQIIPIYIRTGNKNTKTSNKELTFEGFQLQFLVNYIF